ncbi:MAG: aldolase/citrate lyase family protein, partial [bacterium]|nr:aldolase/citrate lyase family protein [bacterium]
AAAAVAACKYPPRGIRGIGPRRGVRFGALSFEKYLETADDNIMVIVQIEHIKAVERIESILDVPGIDSVCIGPSDLSASLGKPGRMDDPQVVDAIDRVMDKARERGMLVGTAVGFSPENVRRWMERGIRWIALNSDCANIFLYGRMIVTETQKALPAGRQ